MKLKRHFLAAVVAAAMTVPAVAPAHAACDFRNTTPLKSLSAGFEAWKVVTDAMAECGNFQPELDQEFRTKQPAAFAANPSQYHIGGVATSTILPLLGDGTIRPLDDLVAKHGANIPPVQLIRRDGKVYAVAMMVNAQHLMFRKDILAKLGIAPPQNYDQVLAAAAKIRDAGVVDYPLGGTFKAGWNLAQEFVNMHLGFGGKFFNADKTPAVNGPAGVKALEMMKALSEFMDPEFLVSDSTYVQQQFQQEKIAMANLWGSRAGAMDDAEESKVVGLVDFAAAPAATPGGKPATTLWWDGMVVAQNITDAEAEAAFRLIVNGISPGNLSAHKSAAVWMAFPDTDSRAAIGTAASQKGGAPAYPASTEMSLMHTALGNNIADFLNGKESASQALADIEDAYATAAKEAGVL